MLTRQTFGAFDRGVWTVQWILTELGYDAGPVDGLWGSRTFGGVSDFRQIQGLGPARGVSYREAADDDFMTALWGQVIEYGLDVPQAPGSGSSGGTGTSITPTNTGVSPGGAPSIPSIPTARASTVDLTTILALGAVGVGAILLWGKSRR